jgi:UPF0755 protein
MTDDRPALMPAPRPGGARAGRRTLGLVALAWLLALAGCATADDTEVVLTIRPGSSFREAADSLAAHGVVRFPRLFGFYAARRGRDRSTRYGMYVIRRGASWNGILHALQTGEGIMNRVTIPEGWPLWETLPVLANTLELPLDSLEAAVRDPALLARLGIPRRVETAEGYLFPDTYDFPKGVTAREAVELMVRRFESRWDPAWDARLAMLKQTRHEVVTLASIVEKEAVKDQERPIIAGVYRNRLRIGMALQADPTVQYALRQRPGRVLLRHLKVDSPYNTYRNPGLPPGPIAAPGRASLEATLFPASVPYRFFVAHPDGHHEFRKTYAEHLEAIVMVREVARRDSIARADSVVRDSLTRDSLARDSLARPDSMTSPSPSLNPPH